jgi:hypothetical protein
MGDALERAAKAVIGLRASAEPHGPDEYASAAILAFLDPDDEGMRPAKRRGRKAKHDRTAQSHQVWRHS